MALIVGLAVLGTLCSIFLGLFAVRVHVFGGHEPYKDMQKPGWQWWVYQFWFNFARSLLGWAAVPPLCSPLSIRDVEVRFYRR